MDLRADVPPGISPCPPVAAAGCSGSWARSGSTTPLGWDVALPCSGALPLPEMLLACSGTCRRELTTWCQPDPTTASWGAGPALTHPPWAGPRGSRRVRAPGSQGTRCPGPAPVPQGIAGTSGSRSASPQHRGSRRHRRPPPRAGEPGTYAAFSRRGNTTCSAPCSAPGRRAGSPSPRCPPGCPHQPPAPSGARPPPSSQGHPWVARAPEPHGTAQPLPNAVPADRDESSFPAPPGARTQPGAGTRCRHPPSAPAVGSLRTRERCWGGGEPHGYS